MPTQLYTAILEDKLIYNSKFTHYSFELREPHRLEFQAGQYVSIQVADDGSRRLYSIISSPSITHGFEILVESIAHGLGSRFLEQLKFGDEISLLAPMGEFTINHTQDERAIHFIATGSGIAPIRCMLFDLLQNRQDSRKIQLYWGLRHPNDLIWQNDFLNLSETYSNFKFHPVMSQPLDEWTLCRGRVTDCLLVHDLMTQAGYYLCGSQEMVADVTKILIEKEVDKKFIHSEKYY